MTASALPALLDVALVLLLVLAFAVGWWRGVIAGLGGLLGLAAGALASVGIVPWVAEQLTDDPWRFPALIGVVLALLIGGSAVGTALVSPVWRRMREHPVRVVDRVLGGVLDVGVTALALSLAGSIMAGVGGPYAAAFLARSEVLRHIEGLTPDPVGRLLARVETTVRDDALPAVGGVIWGEGQGPVISVATPPEPMDLEDPDVAQATHSVGRITATAHSCATGSVGSGFVVGEDRMITNAHVVAGSDAVVVELPGLPAAEAEVVYFDAEMDAAVLQVSGDVAGEGGAPILPVGPSVAAGTPAVVVGYPLGGPMTAVPAGVLGVGSVLFPQDGVADPALAPRREAYRLQATVEPGNSGGPVVADDGSVAGMLFARDDTEDGIAWAITADEVRGVLEVVPGGAGPVDTGQCQG